MGPSSLVVLRGLAFFLMTGLRESRFAIVVLLRCTHPDRVRSGDDLERGLVADAGATRCPRVVGRAGGATAARDDDPWATGGRSEEHTSELQSRFDLV